MVLTEEDQLRAVGLWTAASAERVLALFEARVGADSRPREAVDAIREFGHGGRRVGRLRFLSWAAHAAAGEASDPVAKAAARAASMAAASAYMHPSLLLPARPNAPWAQRSTRRVPVRLGPAIPASATRRSAGRSSMPRLRFAHSCSGCPPQPWSYSVGHALLPTRRWPSPLTDSSRHAGQGAGLSASVPPALHAGCAGRGSMLLWSGKRLLGPVLGD